MAESATGIFQEVEFSLRLAAFWLQFKKPIFLWFKSHISLKCNTTVFFCTYDYITQFLFIDKYNIKHFEDERFSALNCLYPDIIRFLLGDKKEKMLLDETQMTPLSTKEAIYCF